MPNEPSLSELTNISPNPGAPAPVIDNSRMVDTLNQNARYHAENVWRKYNKFLENKKDLYKNIEDIQELDTLQEDKEVLNKQAGEVLKQILKDPAAIMGGKGYDEIQSKIAKFRSDAVASKQANLDLIANKAFLNRTPELNTDENIAAIQNELKKPIEVRKSVLLNLPAIFDEKTAFEGIVKGATNPYTAIVGADGKPGEGYIESGNEINPQAIQGAWNLALQGQKDKYGHSILGAVKYNYDKLPDEVKAQYEANGGIEKYFADRGKQYIDAYFPEGSYEKTPEGNYRFGKKLVADPNYLGKERLAEQQRYHDAEIKNQRDRIALGWANYGLAKRRLDEVDDEDLSGADTVLNEAAGILNNASPIRVMSMSGKHYKDVLRISDPTLLQAFGNVDKDGNKVNVPDAINYDPKTNQPTLLYFRPKKKGATGGDVYEKEIPLDQRTWIKVLAKRSFPNKDIGRINVLLDEAITKNENSLFKLSQKVNERNKGTSQPEATEKQKTNTNSKTIKIKGYDMPKIK